MSESETLAEVARGRRHAEEHNWYPVQHVEGEPLDGWVCIVQDCGTRIFSPTEMATHEARIRAEFVAEVERKWLGGSGHRDTHKWVTIADLKRAAPVSGGVAARKQEASLAPCRHCGKTPEVDGDHTCSRPHSDSECRDHPKSYAWCDGCKRRHSPGERCPQPTPPAVTSDGAGGERDA